MCGCAPCGSHLFFLGGAGYNMRAYDMAVQYMVQLTTHGQPNCPMRSLSLVTAALRNHTRRPKLLELTQSTPNSVEIHGPSSRSRSKGSSSRMLLYGCRRYHAFRYYQHLSASLSSLALLSSSLLLVSLPGSVNRHSLCASLDDAMQSPNSCSPLDLVP